MSGESSGEVREWSFACEKGSMQPENRSSPAPSWIRLWRATDGRWNESRAWPERFGRQRVLCPCSQPCLTAPSCHDGAILPGSVRGLLLFGGRFFRCGFGSRFSGFFGGLFGGVFDGEFFWGRGWLAGDLLGQFVERLADVLFEFCQRFGEAVGAFANLFESGSAFGAESGFTFGEPLAQQLARGVGLAGGFVKGLFKLVNELAGFIEVNFHGVCRLISTPWWAGKPVKVK